MPTVDDLKNIKLIKYNIYKGPRDLGVSQVGSLRIRIGGQYIDVDNADQFTGLVQSFEQGFVPEVSMTMLRSDFDFVMGEIMKDRARLILDGTKKRYTLSNLTQALYEKAEPLWLHPSGLPLTDRRGDIYFYLAIPKVNDTELLGSRDDIQNVALNFVVFPDVNRPIYDQYASFGDPSAELGVPLGVAVRMNYRTDLYSIHVPALSLDQDAKDQLNCCALWGDESGETLTINGDIVGATTKTGNFTGLTTANILVIGSLIKEPVSGEVLLVTDVTYNVGGTSGAFEAVRKYNGTPETATITDTTVMDILATDTTGLTLETLWADWLSSDITKVIVGDSVAIGGDEAKGRVKHVATGAANITATVNTVTSPNVAITAE